MVKAIIQADRGRENDRNRFKDGVGYDSHKLLDSVREGTGGTGSGGDVGGRPRPLPLVLPVLLKWRHSSDRGASELDESFGVDPETDLSCRLAGGARPPERGIIPARESRR